MDKVRAFLRVLYLQRFWVLSGLGVIVAAICWKLAAGALDAEFATHMSTIKNNFDDMTNITGKQVLGNASVNDKEREQAVIIRGKVLDLWQTMYERQKKQVLKWPAALGDDFLGEVEGKKFRESIRNELRQRYREYAKEVFPDLVAIVEAKKMDESAMGFGGIEGGGGRDGGRDGGRGFSSFSDMGDGEIAQYDAEGNLIEPEKYLVQWLDQPVLRQQLNFPQLPTATQVWITQEDLWVYETMLHAIAGTNEARGASRPDNAAIRWIVALEVGQKAAFASKQRGNMILAASPAGEATGMDGGMEGGRGGYGTDGSGTAVDLDTALLASRYIGEDGQPIADASTDPGGEFRMLPVRMQLYMEQSAIPDILVECANAALPIEVKRIRINPEQSGAGFDAALAVPGAGGGVESGRGFSDSGGRGYDGGGRGGYDGGGRGGGEGMMSMPTTPGTGPGLATVEIQGIVYIYNPPDPTTMSVPGADETTPAAEVAASEPAPATPL